MNLKHRAAAAATLGAWALALTLTAGLSGCANVKPFEREILADPIMQANLGFGPQTVGDKFYSTREGSFGGGSGVGGGCGCSK